MRRNPQYLAAVGATVMFCLVAVNQHGSDAVGQQPLQDGGDSFFRRVFPDPEQGRASQENAKRLLVAADDAYQASVADFKARKVTDPEMVYRWSMRIMKAAQAVEDSPAPAAKKHLQRIQELKNEVERLANDEDKKRFSTAVRYYEVEAMGLVDGPAGESTRWPRPGSNSATDSRIRNPRKTPPTEPFGIPTETEPKVTRIVHLKHAHAQTLRNTLGELLKDTANLKLGFDEATNTLLVRGSAESVEEVEALVIALDAPSTRTAPAGSPRVPTNRPELPAELKN